MGLVTSAAKGIRIFILIWVPWGHQGPASQMGLLQAFLARAEVNTAAPSAGQKIAYAVSIAPQHDWPGHVECAARGSAIVNSLTTAGLTATANPDQA